MKSRALLLNVVLFLAVVLAACGGAATQEVMMEKPQESMMEEKPEEPAAEPTHDAMMEKPAETASTPDPMSAPAEEAMMDAPAWFGAPLTDVRTGQTFSVDDFKGKVVLVETMAVWCTTCLRQQGEVKALHEQLGARDDFVSIGLDIDPNENAEALKTYVEDKGFDWLYTVPPTDVSREIASLYGDQFLNPPSAPMFVIDRKGDAHPLPFGVKSVDDLRQAIQPLLDESM
jgi:cytochrome oxidase Cu insertion factor (SCO1/SenC/PrrC family)